MNPAVIRRSQVRPGWGNQIGDAEWRVYHQVVKEARRSGVRFAFGGAFATAVYTGDLRNIKDFDFYILPQDRAPMIAAITQVGLEDHYHRLPYDRSWIYRASTGDVIVDAIWAMANSRTVVDDRWLDAGPEVTLRGETIRAIPVEELIWSKLYVLQRERCDWGDVFNLIDARAETIDWGHLIDRIGADAPLLAGAVTVFAWLAPDRASAIPAPVWKRLGLLPPRGAAEAANRANLLDSRPWFHRSNQR
ncbi:MAG: hypothetical protein ACJ8BF_07905 [Gemmatimonadales bacterium]